MSGDYSRQRFNAGNNYSGVYMQQGRVQLDADWNEWVDVVDRRLRAETVDILGVRHKPGIEGVAVVSAQTPDAFKVGFANGNLTIEPGRIYVDGLLAENHGGGQQQFDPILAELKGKDALRYGSQPYYPNPPALPATPYLAYLEVWQREVTHHEQPDLVESAVGVDTTTRLQTVWQVRTLGEIGGIDCKTPDNTIKGWRSLKRPSGGRLSTRAAQTSQETQPCDIPVGGGYRGIENRTYRAEIHNGGNSDTATFKWSRDNASVVSRVAEIISNKKLKLVNPDRDDSLRFSTGQWVEIIDDWRELSGKNGNPSERFGEVRKITVDPSDSSVITFDPPIDFIPAGATEAQKKELIDVRHLRVRRWDQADGLIGVQAAFGKWYELEKGVEINLALRDGDEFRSGDYWIFTARTTGDVQVEKLEEAPPRGIHRHYARLAVVKSASEIEDCRTVWPPSGCCTVTVAPGEDIQAAIDSLPAEGGCVCLKTGVHKIDKAIEIFRSYVVLRGESPGAVVTSRTATTLLRVSRTNRVIIESLHFEALATTEKLGGVVLWLEHCWEIAVTRCTVNVPLTHDLQHQPRQYLGALLRAVRNADISHCNLSLLMGGISVTNSLRINIRNNNIAGAVALNRLSSPIGETGITVAGGEDVGAWCQVTDNVILDFATAVLLKDQADHSLVQDNYVRRRYSDFEPKPLKDPQNPQQLQAYMDSRLYAFDIGAANSRVQRNQIYLLSAQCGGIRVSAEHVAVERNTLWSAIETGKREGLVPGSIYCLANAKEGSAADDVAIRGNSLQGAQTGIAMFGINKATVSDNQIAGSGGGVCGIVAYDCIGSRIESNGIRNVSYGVLLGLGQKNTVINNDIDGIGRGRGITAGAEDSPVVAGNSVESVAAAGIGLFGCTGTATIRNNAIANCGYGSAGGSTSPAVVAMAANLQLVMPSSSSVRIEGCDITDAGISADGKETAPGAVWSVYCWLPACEIIDNRVNYETLDKLDPQREHRALQLVGPRPVHVWGGAMQPSARPMAARAGGRVPVLMGQPFGSALVSNNRFHGFGGSSLVEMYPAVLDGAPTAFMNVTFSNNVCEHLNAIVSKDNASVDLWGGHLIAIGNHVKGGQGVHAMSLGQRDKVTLLGNITTGSYINVGTVTPTPINSYNVVV